MASGVGEGHKECCDCYRGRLRTTRDAVVDTGYRGWLRTTNLAFCGNLVRRWIYRVLWCYKGMLRTTWLLCWLHG